MLVSTASVLQPIDQGVNSTSKSYDLRNAFYKTKSAINGDSSDGCGQSKSKTLWKEFTILDAVKNICDSREEIKISTLTGV